MPRGSDRTTPAARRRDFVSRTLHSRNGKLPLIKIWAGRKRATETAYTECIKGSRLTERHGVTATQSSSDNGRRSGEWIFYCRCAVSFVFLPTSLSLFLSLSSIPYMYAHTYTLFLSFSVVNTCHQHALNSGMRFIHGMRWCPRGYRELFMISIENAGSRNFSDRDFVAIHTRDLSHYIGDSTSFSSRCY